MHPSLQKRSSEGLRNHRYSSGRCRLHIVGETLVDVNHCLMAAPGVAKEEIRRVISHPQACTGRSREPCHRLGGCGQPLP